MPSGVQVAGTNRSGAKRRRATSENSTADHPEPGRSLAEQPLDQHRAGNVDLNSEQAEMETHTEGDGEVVIEERGGENQDREVVHLSPTNFDTARMPRTVSASVFTNVKTMATTFRVQISNGLKKCDKLVQDLQELD